MKTAIAYYRVSTDRQGKSGLGLEAQQYAVHRHAEATKLQVVKEFTEVESGKHSNRPQLLKALAYCSKHKAILIIAKLDRLARNVAFIASLIERKIALIVTDRPNASKIELYFEAVINEYERDKGSVRTREALQAAKKRGVVLGKHGKILAQKNKRDADEFAMRMQAVFEKLRSEGFKSTRKIAKELNKRRVRTFSKRGKWHAKSVHNVMRRVKRILEEKTITQPNYEHSTNNQTSSYLLPGRG